MIKPLAGFLIVSLFVMPCSAAGSPGTHGNALSRKVDAIFAQWDNERSPGCAIAVIRDSAVVYHRGYGMADIQKLLPNGRNVLYDIGSVSKQFTAMCVLLLERDGKLSLDDDIRAHLPELPDYGESVTIGHLIFHTSGIPEYGVDVEKIATNAAALADIRASRRLESRPGARFEYSNAGYVLLGQIVERVSGKTLRQFAHERIFEPLGMSHTWFCDELRGRIPGHARGYDRRKRGGYFLEERPTAIVGDGNIRSSIDDLARWAGNFSANRLGGGKDLIDLFTTPRSSSENDGVLDYAFGMHVDRYGGLRRFVHEGTWYGFTAAFLHFPEQRFTVIVLANLETMKPVDLAERVADLYLANRMSADCSGMNPHDRWGALEYAG